MAARSLQTTPTMPTTRRRGSGSGLGARAAQRSRRRPPCRSRTSMIWMMGCKNAVFVLLCVRVRASSRAFCLKAQLSRLAQERRYATLTAARQTLQELRVAICNARTAFPLTPLAVVAKQVCRALTLSLREKARAARPARRRDVSATTAPVRTPCTLETPARAPRTTWAPTSGPSAWASTTPPP